MSDIQVKKHSSLNFYLEATIGKATGAVKANNEAFCLHILRHLAFYTSKHVTNIEIIWTDECTFWAHVQGKWTIKPTNQQEVYLLNS